MVTDTAKEIELISDSLELYAERHGDIAPRVYMRFFELNLEAAALMEYSDEYMRGRMFASVLELFLSDEHLDPGGYLAWELENHIKAYSTTTAMYESLFQSMRDVFEKDLGAEWRPEWQHAWASRIARIMQQVAQF
ncbi:globin [Candidatus Paraluminiphilus aquimaris]|uniref:Globin n=1 Tax=Candidatus Paraluminiphilus aquimaris TaxID=2518994 RepID=A0ABY6Q7R3_9GAMM|nr:globin [Candidatus Paraluminiphilus aquimaris]UZP74428.1 globin [Candidatus Paraluminiphilus aquimaris]